MLTLALAAGCFALLGVLGSCSRNGFDVNPDARARGDAARVDALRRESGVQRDGATRDGAPADQTPDAFAFTTLTDQPLGSIILSNAPAITGFDGALLASVTGGGSPALQVEGGEWGPTALLRPGQTLRLRLTSSPEVLTTSVAVVSVGTARVNWSVRTKSGSTRIFATPGTFTGNLGGLGTAHVHCQLVAAALGYDGIFRALLSTRGIAAGDLLTISYPDSYPVVRASDGVEVDAVNLWDGFLLKPVSTTTGGAAAWTGGMGTEAASNASETCNDWRSTVGLGQAGVPQSTDTNWIRYGYLSDCGVGRFLYCIEQPRALGPVLTVVPRAAAMVVVEQGSPGYGTPVTFTVENVGDETSGPLATSLSNTTNFELITNGCVGKRLTSGMACTVVVRPRAWNVGSFSGALDVSGNNPTQASLGLVAGTLVFRTASTYGGNLGGLAGADAICSAAAAGAGYPGAFKAVLSDATTLASDRFSIRYPVITTNGKVVADANFWSQSPQNGGALSLGSTTSFVWTGTLAGGTRSADTCRNWTSDSGSDLGARGDTTSANCGYGSIFNCGSASCHSGYSLMCMGQ